MCVNVLLCACKGVSRQGRGLVCNEACVCIFVCVCVCVCEKENERYVYIYIERGCVCINV
jgi:hypothetical protein